MLLTFSLPHTKPRSLSFSASSSLAGTYTRHAALRAPSLTPPVSRISCSVSSSGMPLSRHSVGTFVYGTHHHGCSSTMWLSGVRWRRISTAAVKPFSASHAALVLTFATTSGSAISDAEKAEAVSFFLALVVSRTATLQSPISLAYIWPGGDKFESLSITPSSFCGWTPTR